MRVKFNEFLALVYADIFDYPLTQEEMRLWQVVPGFQQMKADLADEKVERKGSFLFLKGRGKLVGLRKEREEISKKKLLKTLRLLEILRKVWTVKAVFVTGSVAAGNAKEESDIDLMIVTKQGSLWVTRLTVVGILKAMGKYRGNQGNQGDKICPNIFLDEDHLGIGERNLYTAHEVLQARCVFDRGGIYLEWLRKNRWGKEYLPKAYKYQILNIKYQKYRLNHKNFFGVLLLIELMAFLGQYLFMKVKITNERVGWGYAFFHPRDLSVEVYQEFFRRLKRVNVIQ